ncbi:MAG: hypothetical protein M0Z50_10800 [Planctomycetia bacterium]|jgi:hypothetical protein|nr:hypothetical protein [Planctomycetia bacterium]
MIASDECDIFDPFHTLDVTPDTAYDFAESGLPLEAHKGRFQF